MSAAQESGSWSRVYGYDAYGNRWAQSANHTLSFATPTAQLGGDRHRPAAYSGQQHSKRVAMTFTGQRRTPVPVPLRTSVGAMAYDAENHQTSFTNGGATTTYQYDGDGRGVKKLQGARILHHPGRFGPAC